jgi:hypothetical protein
VLAPDLNNRKENDESHDDIASRNQVDVDNIVGLLA